MKKPGKLIVVPTPIGNQGDMTKRARESLETCDVVCCEDTRVTGKLLVCFGISKPLERLDEAVLSTKARSIVDRISAGEIICYCTDAGMPGVSDPGQRLITQAYESGVEVEVLPGASAVTLAYVASGFSASSFYFGAFFPRKDGERARILESLKSLDAVLIFYESPHRLVSALRVIQEVFPHRQVAVCRELTKVHEEVVRGLSSEVFRQFQSREECSPLKGEIVIVIDVASDSERHNEKKELREKSDQIVAFLLEKRGLSSKEAVKVLQSDYGFSRNEAYDLVHRIR